MLCPRGVAAITSNLWEQKNPTFFIKLDLEKISNLPCKTNMSTKKHPLDSSFNKSLPIHPVASVATSSVAAVHRSRERSATKRSKAMWHGNGDSVSKRPYILLVVSTHLNFCLSNWIISPSFGVKIKTLWKLPSIFSMENRHFAWKGPQTQTKFRPERFRPAAVSAWCYNPCHKNSL